MNLFTEAPTIDIPRMPANWTCPVTGYVVPKTLAGNLAFRGSLLKQAETDVRLQKELIAACRESILLWLNLFVWTESFFAVNADGSTLTRQATCFPFITWPKQDELILKLCQHRVDSKSLLVEKSREVGATWMVLEALLHPFLFHSSSLQFAMLSLKEDDVDSFVGDIRNYPYDIISDTSSLFGKLDYTLKNLPAWMLPPMRRKRLSLINAKTRSLFDGGACGTFALSSQRRHAIIFDEASKIDTFRTIWEGTQDVSKCRFPISTPVGLGSYFTQLRNAGQIEVYELGWWHDPSKACDLEVETLPNNRFKYTSSWYRTECSKRSATDIAQNLDILHIESGTAFFPTAQLLEYRRKTCLEAPLRLSIDFRPEVPEADIVGILATRNLSKLQVTASPTGPWRMWTSNMNVLSAPVEGEYPNYPTIGQPLVFGIDISLGTGASNSVISVLNRVRRVKIAEFASANVPPHRLAKIACAAALWFGREGPRPTIIFESNGVGGFDFARQIVQLYHYPMIYMEHTMGRRNEKKTQTAGFHSSARKKAALLGNLSRAYQLGNYFNFSAEAISEAVTYSVWENGKIGPAGLMRESEDAKATHGDRVIADALTLWVGHESEAAVAERKLAKEAALPCPIVDIKTARFPASQYSGGWRMQHPEEFYLADQRRKEKKLENLKSGTRFNVRDYLG